MVKSAQTCCVVWLNNLGLLLDPMGTHAHVSFFLLIKCSWTKLLHTYITPIGVIYVCCNLVQLQHWYRTPIGVIYVCCNLVQLYFIFLCTHICVSFVVRMLWVIIYIPIVTLLMPEWHRRTRSDITKSDVGVTSLKAMRWKLTDGGHTYPSTAP